MTSSCLDVMACLVNYAITINATFELRIKGEQKQIGEFTVYSNNSMSYLHTYLITHTHSGAVFTKNIHVFMVAHFKNDFVSVLPVNSTSLAK